MSKTMTKAVVVFLAVFLPLHMIFAFPQVFGGRITNSKAIEIDALEKANFACIVFGSTFTIAFPVVGPISFYVPSWKPARAGSLQAGANTLGTIDGMETITCIYKGYPPAIKTVQLHKVNIWGTSAK